MGGFRKCKVHFCNFKGFKVISLLTSASLGPAPFNIGKLAHAGAWVQIPEKPNFKDW